jgi:glucokinase
MPKPEKVVLTLAAGGTNFVFSALADASFIGEPITLPSHGHDLQASLHAIIEGFNQLKHQIQLQPDAISFAFPGPADYARGIIGDLENLPAYRGGVALGPMLEQHFEIPVSIRNDGDLFTLGEAWDGFLPHYLGKEAIGKQNLLGVTLGTGFGGGLVYKGEAILGNNTAAGEVWLLVNGHDSMQNAEPTLSIRVIRNLFKHYYGWSLEQMSGLTPAEIAMFGIDVHSPHHEAATKAYSHFGKVLGMSLAQAVTLFDAHVVIGGGLARAWDLYAPAMFETLNGSFASGPNRICSQAYNAKDEKGLAAFREDSLLEVSVPHYEHRASYRKHKRILVGRSILGTNKAVALGAYRVAVENR